ncbi:transketolase, pyrimidine binding domain protein, partial [Vibrio parahaemolyticus V-223/04]
FSSKVSSSRLWST